MSQKHKLKQPHFLPMYEEEIKQLGWNNLDVLFITGDAYVDHPAFGLSLLGRWLIHHGFRVGIIAQPNWLNIDDITRMGCPNLFIGVTAGALDSQLAHYTAFRKKRSDDSYSPGGKCGLRPNRASIVYSNLARKAFPDTPIVLGGIEASLRKVSHYDFWKDALRRSILLDAKADLLLYGMGELSILECANRCQNNQSLTHIKGSVWVSSAEQFETFKIKHKYIALPSFDEISSKPALLIDATLSIEQQMHNRTDYAVEMSDKRAIIVAPPALSLSPTQLDTLYDLPYRRASHVSYKLPIPAEQMLHTSITSHRGCGGGCSFCSLSLHQGRHISSRSEKSILDEVDVISKIPKFNGSISDVGGPTANMWQSSCAKPDEKCLRSSCCHPNICKFFNVNQHKHIKLLQKIKEHPKIKHVRVASGIRADLAIKDAKALYAYTIEFTGGQLKIAPEHCSNEVLKLMRKPSVNVFETFLTAFNQFCKAKQLQQFVIPYLMSAFPGCTDQNMLELAAWLKSRNWKPQQVQCFIPTPGTIATAMYYSGFSPDGKKIFVAKSDAARIKQHRILAPEFGRKFKR